MSINMRSCFIITDYDARFIVWDGSVGVQFLTPQHGNLTALTLLTVVPADTNVLCLILPQTPPAG
jgi:hypothetical protein